MTRDAAATFDALETIGLAGRLVLMNGSVLRTATWEDFAK
jgi:hypothetical protein